jgi:hypothetical protein
MENRFKQNTVYLFTFKGKAQRLLVSSKKAHGYGTFCLHIEETKGTLQFASRAKRITNCAQVNEKCIPCSV